MKVISNVEKLDNDLLDEVKLFFRVVDDVFVEHHFSYLKGLKNSFLIKLNGIEYKREFFTDFNLDGLSELHQKRYIKRYAKLNLYSFLSELTNKTIDWGSLTGVRPTILAYNNLDNYEKELKDTFLVSDKKIQLIKEIIENQKGLYEKNNKNIDIYIGIPFCPSRCSYCSFSSGELSVYSKYMDDYVKALIKDINAAKELIKEKSFNVRAIYFGGGTPTTLSKNHFELILDCLKDLNPKELTIEAGRPDTINKELLDVFAKYNVNRISINPQTFNEDTLKFLERKHSIKEVYEKFKLAREYNFLINMDLICGLPNETMDDFSNSLNECIKLKPDNITVHSLALKEHSKLKNDEYILKNESLVKDMTEYAYKTLKDIEYKPYYLYRQKYMSDNQENVGYHINNTQCLYNIDTIEESTSIIACGAGGISKRVYVGEEKITRCANIKDIIIYIKQIDEQIKKRRNLFI